MSRVLLFDTNVWSHLLLGEPVKQASVQARLQQLGVKYPGTAWATSRICIAEALVAARRLPDKQAAQHAETALQAAFGDPNLMIVEITDVVAGQSVQVADLAASMRGEALRSVAMLGKQQPGPDGGKLKLPDAIVAASCLAFSPPAVLVTENVKDFSIVGADGALSTVADLTVEGL